MCMLVHEAGATVYVTRRSTKDNLQQCFHDLSAGMIQPVKVLVNY